MTTETATTEVYITTNPMEDLQYVEGWHDLDEDFQESVARTYGVAWYAAVPAAAESLGATANAIVTSDAVMATSHLARNGDRDRDNGPDLVDKVWQAAHDRVAITITKDGEVEIVADV